MGQLLCQLFLLFLTAFCLGTTTPVMAQSELSGQVPSQVDKPENDSVLGGRERSRTSPAAPTPWAPTRQATLPE